LLEPLSFAGVIPIKAVVISVASVGRFKTIITLSFLMQTQMKLKVKYC